MDPPSLERIRKEFAEQREKSVNVDFSELKCTKREERSRTTFYFSKDGKKLHQFVVEMYKDLACLVRVQSMTFGEFKEEVKETACA